MKIGTVVLLTFLPLLSYGQEPDNFELKRNLLKFAPQQFRVKSLKLGIEHFNTSFNKSYSLYFIIRKEKNNQEDYPTGYDGAGIEFQYRAYLKPLQYYTNGDKKGYSQGIYLGVFPRGNSFNGDQFYPYSEYDQAGNIIYSVYQTQEKTSNWGTGLIIGLQHVLWKIITVDLYAGGGVQWSDIKKSGSLPPNYTLYYFYNGGHERYDPGFQGILAKFGAQIGISL